MRYTLNIGDKIAGRAARLVRGEVERAIRHAMVRNKIHQYAYVQGKTYADEGTHVVTVVGPDFNMTALAELLQQDAIAVAWKVRGNDIAWCGELFGKGYAKYGPFDINKFITMEQAMSYGSPQKPDGMAITLADVIKRVEQLEAESGTLGACYQRVKRLELAAAYGANVTQSDEVVLKLTQAEAQYLVDVTGAASDGQEGYRIYMKLNKLGMKASETYQQTYKTPKRA